MVRTHSSSPGNVPLTYTWTANGGSVEGSGPEARWTASDTPGVYTVSLHVDDGHGATGDCSSDVRVAQKVHQPLTDGLRCRAKFDSGGRAGADHGHGLPCGARFVDLLLELRAAAA